MNSLDENLAVIADWPGADKLAEAIIARRVEEINRGKKPPAITPEQTVFLEDLRAAVIDARVAALKSQLELLSILSGV